jgi:hypothetical protein
MSGLFKFPEEPSDVIGLRVKRMQDNTRVVKLLSYVFNVRKGEPELLGLTDYLVCFQVGVI